MTGSKEKRSDKFTFDPASALGTVHTILQQQMGLNRDSVGILSLRDRVAMTGAEGQTDVSSLLINNEESEKKRIARDLHDGLGQLLTSINLHVQQCIERTSSSERIPETMKVSLELISSMTQQAMGEMRDICSALRPAILDDLGVLAAINWQCRQTAQADEALRVTTDFDVHEAMIPDTYKTTIYRIVQEALNNTVKYAEAENLVIRLYQAGDFLQLMIRDDGIGFQAHEKNSYSGMGLISMRERAEAVNGVFELRSGKGQGVEIRVLFPFRRVLLSG